MRREDTTKESLTLVANGAKYTYSIFFIYSTGAWTMSKGFLERKLGLRANKDRSFGTELYGEVADLSLTM